jgi:hypothetical protein
MILRIVSGKPVFQLIYTSRWAFPVHMKDSFVESMKADPRRKTRVWNIVMALSRQDVRIISHLSRFRAGTVYDIAKHESMRYHVVHTSVKTLVTLGFLTLSNAMPFEKNPKLQKKLYRLTVWGILLSLNLRPKFPAAIAENLGAVEQNRRFLKQNYQSELPLSMSLLITSHSEPEFPFEIRDFLNKELEEAAASVLYSISDKDRSDMKSVDEQLFDQAAVNYLLKLYLIHNRKPDLFTVHREEPNLEAFLLPVVSVPRFRTIVHESIAFIADVRDTLKKAH